MNETYKVVRKFFRADDELIADGLSLQEAQEHCQDPETSSRTATSACAIALTEKCGLWFDAYYQE
jgi:hypothetical protein